MCQLQLLGFLITILQIGLLSAQRLPYVACPGLFRYLEYQNEYIGHLKLVLDNTNAENEVRIELSQPGDRAPPTPGMFNFLEDEDSLSYRLRNDEPINYRIDFPTSGVVPKLTKVSVNGEIVCQASEFRPPSIKLKLSRILRTSIPLAALPPPQRSDPPQWSRNPPGNFTEDTPPQRSRPQPPPRNIGVYDEREPPQRSRPQQTPPPPQRQRPQEVPVRPPVPLVPPVQSFPYQTIGQLNGVCGREKTIQTPFIHGGNEVERGQLPWMTALFEQVGKDYNFLCGATLISARTVISAAHCFRFGSRNLPAERTTVSLGRNSLDLFGPGYTSGVSLLLLHEQYNPSVYTDADLALLQLTDRPVFDDFIRPICLWNENYLLDLPSGYKSYVAGWGEDEHGNRNTRRAKMTDTDIITQTECRGNLSAENAHFITSHTICASNALASGPCSGDSGGGLMLQEQDIWLLRGVVSAGQRKTNWCNLTLPVIYTDVAKHMDWLLKSMWF
ncbi:CLIP domain-containing serine protease B15 [Drosophila subpulchrella]|uniref:CLIP domain-containing serine protease B15 n=1 Tax=Drosophila subpulchrella TaxID=1486046 RepID=UPI0018A13D8E|nr:CLIP domain-containing serine protease B15 [Drosophila subpulchrella]